MMEISESADLADLRRRLAIVEDTQAISRLLGALGPVTDVGPPSKISAFYVSDGAYDTDVVTDGLFIGTDQIGAAFDTPMHRAAVAAGVAHTMGAPVVTLDGDSATAVSYTVLHYLSGNEWKIGRVAANCFDLRRTEDGWRIAKRVNRAIGTDEARQLFSTVMLDYSTTV